MLTFDFGRSDADDVPSCGVSREGAWPKAHADAARPRDPAARSTGGPDGSSSTTKTVTSTRSCHRRRLGCGKPNGEGRPPPLVGLSPQSSMMRLDDRTTDRQAEAHTLRL